MTRRYPDSITLGQRDQIVKIGGDAVKAALREVGLLQSGAQFIIEHGDEFGRRIAKVAEEALCDMLDHRSGADALPTWRTIVLGGHKDIAAYRTALQAGGYRIGDYANQIMEKTPIATAETTVDLVQLTPRDIGSQRDASTAEIYAWAEAHGLKKCPAEVGPALRLAYADQPSDEWIRVGMEPIADSGGCPCVFDVEHAAHDRWLYAYWTNPTSQWNPRSVWVFVRSKQ